MTKATKTKATQKAKAKIIREAKGRDKKLATQKARTARAKAASLMASKAASTQGFKTLIPLAKEINARLDKATVADGKAFDHRLSACVTLADAKKVATKAKINWPGWCKDNLTQSPETIRKLVMVGQAENPKLALEDLRIKNARQTALARAKTKAKASMVPVSGKSSDDSSAPARPPTETPAGKVLSGLDNIDREQGQKLIKSKAGEFGLQAVTQTDIDAIVAKEVRKAAPKTKDTKALFSAMDAADKMAFLRWAADQMGAKLITGFEVSDEDPLAIPAALKRNAA